MFEGDSANYSRQHFIKDTRGICMRGAWEFVLDCLYDLEPRDPVKVALLCQPVLSFYINRSFFCSVYLKKTILNCLLTWRKLHHVWWINFSINNVINIFFKILLSFYRNLFLLLLLKFNNTYIYIYIYDCAYPF